MVSYVVDVHDDAIGSIEVRGKVCDRECDQAVVTVKSVVWLLFRIVLSKELVVEDGLTGRRADRWAENGTRLVT